MIRKIAKSLTVLFLLGICAWFARAIWLSAVTDDPVELVNRHFSSGGALTDRNGILLRVFPDERGDFWFYTPLEKMPKNLINAVLTAEDRKFYHHPGFDLTAIFRALWQNITSGRVVSGASTISQQLIRVINPRPRTISTKISELLHALRLEIQADKNLILEKYLNAVCMFGNIRGLHMAANVLFGKDPEMLNLSESATLAAAIQAPGRYNPFSAQGNKKLAQRRNWILHEMLKNKLCQAAEYDNAVKAVIPDFRRKKPFKAPHFCDLVTASFPATNGARKTTIDMRLQDFIYQTARSHLPKLHKRGATQVGIMIADARTLEVLAMTGSAEYGPINGGFNNACTARRSGGSILKPFLYALALESGYYPSFVIPDTMQPFKTPQGDYMPYNANRMAYGPMTIRSALGNSLNISAVKMLNLLGIRPFYSMLVNAGILREKSGAADFYGLGLAIGNPELRMIDVLAAYGAFVNNGAIKTLKYLVNQPQTVHSFISPETAYLVFDMLADPGARLLTFGNPSFFKVKNRTALKTGTSTDYRDCWLMAANSQHLIAIWVGNFSGQATRSLAGAAAAGPIFKTIIDYLQNHSESSIVFAPPAVRQQKVCSISGELPGENCPNTGYELFSGNGQMPAVCSFHSDPDGTHKLSPTYASWIVSRKRHLDADPFVLGNNLKVSDPYQLIGLNRTIAAIAATDASGPLVITPQSQTMNFEGAVKIVSPQNNDRFIFSPSHQNFVHLRAVPSANVSEIIWLINGNEYIRTQPPYEAYWPMEAGHHRICALTDDGAACEIEILIE